MTSVHVTPAAQGLPAQPLISTQLGGLPVVPVGQDVQVKPVPGAGTSLQVCPAVHGLPAQPLVSVQVTPSPL